MSICKTQQIKETLSKKCKQNDGNLPNIIHHMKHVKSVLQKGSQYSGANVYDHLADLIKRIIDDEPQNVADYFDEFSRVIREETFSTEENKKKLNCGFREKHLSANNIMSSFGLSIYSEIKTFESDVEEKIEDLEELTIAFATENILEMQSWWTLCGLNLEIEPLILSYSIEKFANNSQIKQCKFWGKIFGLKRNYYVIEAEFTPEELSKRANIIKNDININAGKRRSKEVFDIKGQAEFYPGRNWEGYSAKDIERMTIRLPPLPIVNTTVTNDFNEDYLDVELNHYTYFVCNDPLEGWTELPIVTPNQIMASRSIRKFLTGNLNAPVISHFPGLEKHYLRAQIARITCGTHISPIWLHNDRTVISSEDIEDENVKDSFINYPVENSSRNPQNIKYWVHSRQIISTDKGCIEFNINNQEVTGEEFDLEADESRAAKLHQETACYFPISNDTNELSVPCWSIRVASKHSMHKTVVIVKSNIWTGSYTILVGNEVKHLYIGWGHKHVKRNLTIMPASDIQKEYNVSPKIIEILDSFEFNDLPLEEEQSLEQEPDEEETEEEDDTEADDD